MTEDRTGRLSGTPEPVERGRAAEEAASQSTTPGDAAGPADGLATGRWLNLESANDWVDRPSASAASASMATLGSETPAAAQSPMPVAIGKYMLVRELGRGGMGVVYQAEDAQLKRPVALKMVLAADFAAADALKRFNREAETVARLQHPNIVQIYEIGAYEGKPFFALEYLAGGTLWETIQGKPQSPQMAAALVKTLAEAVHYAHERGIIHRDLKPSNILLSADGIPKITDFGLAKLDPSVAVSGTTKVAGKGLTRSGEMLGTPSYMAPEQIDSKHFPVGRAADIYSLGAIFYELLTGRPPFNAPNPMETILQVLSREPVPPTRLQPKTPRDLVTICLKCLEKDPRKRFASAKSLAADLQRYLSGQPILARPAGIVEHAWKWTKRQPAVASLLLLVVASITAGFAGISWQLHETAEARDEATAARDLARAEQNKTQEALQQVEAAFYLGQIAQARLEWRTHNVAGAEILLDRCSPDRRGWEWHYLKGLNHTDLMTIVLDTAAVMSVAYCPSGNQAAAACGNPYMRRRDGSQPNQLVILDPATGQALRTLSDPHRNMVRQAAFSPDGCCLATAGGDGVLKIWDASTLDLLLTCDTAPDLLLSLAFSPDGQRIATASEGRTVREWDVKTGKELHPPYRHSGVVRHVVYLSQDRLASAGDDGTRIWDTTNHTEVRHLDPGHGSLSASPDGRLLAVAAGESVKVWELKSGKLVHSLDRHNGDVLAVQFSPDGRFVATAGSDRSIHLWDARHGNEAQVIRGHTGRVQTLNFHPNGRYLLSGSAQPAEIKLWDLTRRQEYELIADSWEQPQALAVNGQRVSAAFGWGSSGALLRVTDMASGRRLLETKLAMDGEWKVPCRRAAFTADSRRLAGVSLVDNRHIVIWDTATGQERLHLSALPGRIYHVAVSGDGRRVAGAAMQNGRRFVQVWDAASGQKLAAFECDAANELLGALTLSADGNWVAFDESRINTQSRNLEVKVHVGEVTNERRVKTYAGEGAWFVSLAFHPASAQLAAGDLEGRIFLWDPASDHVERLQAETPQYQLAFSPDGRRLASVDREKTKVWDVATAREVLLLRAAPARPSDGGYNPQLAWSPDGQQLAATNWTQTISVWDAAERESALAKARVRQLTEGRALRWHALSFDDGWQHQSPKTQQFHRDALIKIPPASAQDWLDRAKVNAGVGMIAEAQADFAKAESAWPDPPALRLQWAGHLARCGLADEAVKAYRQAFASDALPTASDWCNYSCLLLFTGDAEAHRQLCQHFAEWQKEWNLRHVDPLLARCCLLTAESPLPMPQVISWARSGMESDRRADTVHCLGLAHLRAHQLPEAEQELKESLALDSGWIGGALNWFALALVYHRQGKTEDSRKMLALADETYVRIAQERANTAKLPRYLNPLDGVELEFLHQECARIRQEATSQPGKK